MVKAYEEITGQVLVNGIFNDWFKRYTIPEKIITDQGKQYMSKKFLKMLEGKEITHSPTSIYNPQGNSVAERINGTITNILRLEKGNKIKNVLKIIENNLNKCTHRILAYSQEEILNNRSSLDPLIRNLKINFERIKTKEKEFKKSINKNINSKEFKKK